MRGADPLQNESTGVANPGHPTRSIRHGDQIISVNDHYATKMFQPGGELYTAYHVEVKLSRNVVSLLA